DALPILDEACQWRDWFTVETIDDELQRREAERNRHNKDKDSWSFPPPKPSISIWNPRRLESRLTRWLSSFVTPRQSSLTTSTRCWHRKRNAPNRSVIPQLSRRWIPSIRS